MYLILVVVYNFDFPLFINLGVVVVIFLTHHRGRQRPPHITQMYPNLFILLPYISSRSEAARPFIYPFFSFDLLLACPFLLSILLDRF